MFLLGRQSFKYDTSYSLLRWLFLVDVAMTRVKSGTILILRHKDLWFVQLMHFLIVYLLNHYNTKL